MELKEVDWVLQDGIGYLFPQPATINLSNKTETGSWFKINHQSDSPKQEVSKEVFKLWFNHGTRPDNATYQYIVVPNTSEKELTGRKTGEINILSNTTELQAVQHTGLNITEIVFYTAGQVKISDGLSIGMDGPGLLLLHTDGFRPKSITVEDPSRKLSRIHLTTSYKLDKKGDNFSCIWNEEKKVTEIAVDLPLTVYAGKSVTIEI